MKPYTIVNDTWIELTEGPYSGIIYKYGRVELVEEGDKLRVKFEYQLPDGRRMDSAFIQHIGPILTEMIEEGVIKNNITYTGGT